MILMLQHQWLVKAGQLQCSYASPSGPEVVRGARNLSRDMSLPQHLGATCPVERATDNTEECAWERKEKNSPTSQGRTEEDREGN